MKALATLLACVTSGLPLVAGAQAAPGGLPPGPGSEIVAVACVQCHGTGPFLQMREGIEGWRLQVYDMILRGAQIRPAEVPVVAGYLAANFGFGQPLPAAGAPVALKEGADRELVEQRCALCHGLDRLVATPRRSPEWHAIVARMGVLGAPLTAAEAQRVGGYLAMHYGTP